MHVIGLTGGIGSGKTTVADYFSKQGITIIDADQVSRQVVEPGTQGLITIQNYFGQGILTEEGALDRRQLREIIFNNPKAKHWLESLLHPLITQEILNQLQQSTSPYSIIVSPLLLETDQHRFVNRILLVDVPEELQLSRTAQRDQQTVEQVKAIMDTQLSREKRLAMADDVIINDKDLDYIESEVKKLHKQYVTFCKKNKIKA